MRKLFGRDKPKIAKVVPVSREIATGLASNYSEDGHYSPLPSAVQRAGPRDRGYERRRSSSEERWEVVSPYDETVQFNPRRNSTSRSSSFISLPPGASPPASGLLPPRSSSPFSVASHPNTHMGSQRDKDWETTPLKKKPQGSSVAALGILKALEPQNDAATRLRSRSEELLTPPSESLFKPKREKKSFWERTAPKDKEKDQEKDRSKDKGRKDEESQAELTKMIGYLTATSSEDWSLVLEVCERASANESNAKEAVRALRREFKYGEPTAQLSAARLWAIMLRNSSETFIAQSTTRKFLEAVEEIIISSRTSPVVRERLMDVVAAAAFATNTDVKDVHGDKDSFRGLWKRIKPVEKPDEVREFYLIAISLTNILGGQGVPFDTHDAMFNPPSSRPSLHSNESPSLSGQSPSLNPTQALNHGRRHKSSNARDGVISLKEDVRRLFQECKIGQGNASLLSEALAFAKPEDLSKDIIREFYVKCRSSQELIYAQIPWASAGAERSRLARGRSAKPKSQSLSHGEEPPGYSEPTTQEQLLAELLAANEALLEALRVHDDLESMALEKRAQERSRNETTVGQAHADDLAQQPLVSVNGDSQNIGPVLSVPPSAPQGPLMPSPPRTPSPTISDQHSPPSSSESGHSQSQSDSDAAEAGDASEYENYGIVPDEPSAKALGKRRVVDGDEFYGIDITHGDNDFYDRRNSRDSDVEVKWKQDTRYVYDAAAERTKQRIQDGRLVDRRIDTGP